MECTNHDVVCMFHALVCTNHDMVCKMVQYMHKIFCKSVKKSD